MIRANKLKFNEVGEPVFTIVATGVSDVYRLAHHLCYGQVEMCHIGQRAKGGLRRKLGQQRWKDLLVWMHGTTGVHR